MSEVGASRREVYAARTLFHGPVISMDTWTALKPRWKDATLFSVFYNFVMDTYWRRRVKMGWYEDNLQTWPVTEELFTCHRGGQKRVGQVLTRHLALYPVICSLKARFVRVSSGAIFNWEELFEPCQNFSRSLRYRHCPNKRGSTRLPEDFSAWRFAMVILIRNTVCAEMCILGPQSHDFKALFIYFFTKAKHVFQKKQSLIHFQERGYWFYLSS